MAWDASRPVPWRRLVREWLIYVGLMSVLFVVFFRDDSLLAIFAGLVISGPLYLLLGWALAKLGYRRRTLGEARSRVDTDQTDRDVRAPSTPGRPKPAPTRRTGGGSRPGGPRPKR